MSMLMLGRVWFNSNISIECSSLISFEFERNVGVWLDYHKRWAESLSFKATGFFTKSTFSIGTGTSFSSNVSHCRTSSICLLGVNLFLLYGSYWCSHENDCWFILSWISIITLSLWIDDCLKLFLFRLEDCSSFLVIFSDCIKWKDSLFCGVSTIDYPPWKLVWFHFGVRKLPFSLWNSLFRLDGLLDDDWQ